MEDPDDAVAVAAWHREASKGRRDPVPTTPSDARHACHSLIAAACHHAGAGWPPDTSKCGGRARGGAVPDWEVSAQPGTAADVDVIVPWSDSEIVQGTKGDVGASATVGASRCDGADPLARLLARHGGAGIDGSINSARAGEPVAPAPCGSRTHTHTHSW